MLLRHLKKDLLIENISLKKKIIISHFFFIILICVVCTTKIKYTESEGIVIKVLELFPNSFSRWNLTIKFILFFFIN